MLKTLERAQDLFICMDQLAEVAFSRAAPDGFYPRAKGFEHECYDTSPIQI
jgi:hypothetical protein